MASMRMAVSFAGGASATSSIEPISPLTRVNRYEPPGWRLSVWLLPLPSLPFTSFATSTAHGAGDLPADELVERHILVEGLDDEIAVLIGVRAIVVVLVTAALGEAGQVEPVPAPALAVMR